MLEYRRCRQCRRFPRFPRHAHPTLAHKNSPLLHCPVLILLAVCAGTTERWKLTFTVDEPLQEMLVAELADRGFESFEQTKTTLSAYAAPTVWSDELNEVLRDWLIAKGSTPEINVTIIPDKNWNEIWEASLQPIDAGRFTVKPSWKSISAEDDRIVIEIDPKMSFGTGLPRFDQARPSASCPTHWIPGIEFSMPAPAPASLL